jgi:phosphatidate cytidylyltransferase
MFRTRLLTGILLVIIALGTIIPGGYILFGLILVISLVGFSELLRVFQVERTLLGVCGYLFTVLYFLNLRFGGRLFGDYFLSPYLEPFKFIVLVYLIVLLMIMVFTFPKYEPKQVLASFFGFFYVVVMLSFVYQVRMLPLGMFVVWLIFICAWGSDTCAYCAGLTLGKRRLAPSLSPKKSVEGAIGGVLGAALLGFLYALAINHFSDVGVNVIAFTVIGAIGSVISQIGDLAASAFKRHYDVKDYGKFIPGHGGILDRFDSVIFVAPVIFHLAIILL